jgi:DNA-binding winged helix-turn-helix (wHTH) protein
VRLTFDEFVLDSDTRQLLRGGGEVHLSPKAFDLLSLLIESRPKALSKDRLQTALWPNTFVSEGNLSVLVAEIRRALREDARSPRSVRTVPRFGYAFMAAVLEDAPPSGATTPKSSHWLTWGRRLFELPEGEVVVGRDPHCQVHLDLPGVSRRHARLQVTATGATIEDLGSKNGTRKGGEPLVGVVSLEDDERLEFGTVTVRYRQWSGLDSTASRRSRSGTSSSSQRKRSSASGRKPGR